MSQSALRLVPQAALRVCTTSCIEFVPQAALAHVHVFQCLAQVCIDSNPLVKSPDAGTRQGLAKRVIACLDVRANDAGDLVVTKGDQYDVRDKGTAANDVRNLGLPVQLAGRYFVEGADEVTFLNITGFRDFPLGDLPMLEVCASLCFSLAQPV